MVDSREEWGGGELPLCATGHDVVGQRYSFNPVGYVNISLLLNL